MCRVGVTGCVAKARIEFEPTKIGPGKIDPEQKILPTIRQLINLPVACIASANTV